MIMVDIQVPSVGRNYNFQLDEQVPVSSLIMEITEMVCQKKDVCWRRSIPTLSCVV